VFASFVGDIKRENKDSIKIQSKKERHPKSSGMPLYCIKLSIK